MGQVLHGSAKAAKLPEMPIVRDEFFNGFMREEGESLMFGAYERPEDVELTCSLECPRLQARDALI